MAYTNSSLVSYTRLSPNYNPRNNTVKKITIHHQAGNLSLETLGNIVANPSRQMSCNYGIDSQGRIGLYCEEKNRSWCSSSPENDHQAITIEVANDEVGGNWHVSDKAMDSLIKLCVDICKRNGIARLNFTGDKNGNLTAHRYFSNTLCPGPYLYSKFPWIAEQVNKQLSVQPVQPTKGTQATLFASMTNEQVMAKVGPLFTADQKSTGVLACVSMAQFILESSYGKSELAQNANNCFGMKKYLSGNTWTGSKWDGVSVYNKVTKEQNTNGNYISVNADFRKYACVEDSIADHSAYLIGAKNGSALRYNGLKGETDYKKAVQIVKDGGYATSASYVTNLCNIIEKYGLTKYNASASETPKQPVSSTKVLYRVRKSWSDAASQIGAYANLDNAKKACRDGYHVYDENGNAIYPVNTPVVSTDFAVGDEVRLVSGATYIDGKAIPNWVINSKLYVREIRSDGNIIFSTVKTGAITGVAAKKYFIKSSTFSSYTVKITVGALNIRSGPGINYEKVGCITDRGIYTIVAESNGWGKLKSTNFKGGAGWISLNYTKKN